MRIRWSTSLRAVSSLLLAAVAGLLVAACATTYPPAPTLAASPDYNYLIGPGDIVNIVVWRNPELSTTVPVRPDGKIATALVEDLPAQGKDSTTLARDIEKALAKYIRDPIVTVVVTNFVGPYSEQIRVVGEATKPQALPYKQKMTLLDVMIAVGGITDFADGEQRHDPAHRRRQQAILVRIKDLHQARRRVGQRGDEARRRAHHSAELVLRSGAGRAGIRRRSRASRRATRWTIYSARH